ncbi:hypothetical protein IWT25_02561 [Secundilactobacillus pentosiphilus]|uniref:Uncharacterized protein n=1 Tax=Secundilactobacillus pentosiphilus TaxID=1714682 RepID=A0A1Z5J060_9LACO|nr:hypothetical protein [Secundilactobacillus pentosiphilus]GAX07212.1 hypothetical protein IWT25_02561 [Secundilactobacillus pentosiphilus]
MEIRTLKDRDGSSYYPQSHAKSTTGLMTFIRSYMANYYPSASRDGNPRVKGDDGKWYLLGVDKDGKLYASPTDDSSDDEADMDYIDDKD